MPDQSLLRALLDYDPATGELIWRSRSPGIFQPSVTLPPTCLSRRWNTRYADREAFAHTDDMGYRSGRLLGRNHRAHRVIWKWMTGVEPNIVDHINGDRADNRWANLRSTDDVGNARNSALPSHNKSGHRGIHFNLRRKKWVAYIGVSRKPLHLGSFATMQEAIAARELAEVEHGYHANHGRAV